MYNFYKRNLPQRLNKRELNPQCLDARIAQIYKLFGRILKNYVQNYASIYLFI